MLLRQQLLRFPLSMRLAAATNCAAPPCGCGRSLLAASQTLLRHRPQLQQQQQQQLQPLEAGNLAARQAAPRRGLRLMLPVCMGRRSSKIATRKASIPSYSLPEPGRRPCLFVITASGIFYRHFRWGPAVMCAVNHVCMQVCRSTTARCLAFCYALLMLPYLSRMQQNAQDQKRAKVWGALAKKIIQAAKAGGPDVAANQRLAEVIKAAKAAEVITACSCLGTQVLASSFLQLAAHLPGRGCMACGLCSATAALHALLHG